MKKIGVLGAGTWGIALARMLCNIGNDITVWSAVDKEIDALVKTYEQPNLKGIRLPQEIKFTKDIKDAVEGMDIILFAVASPYVRATAHRIADKSYSLQYEPYILFQPQHGGKADLQSSSFAQALHFQILPPSF